MIFQNRYWYLLLVIPLLTGCNNQKNKAQEEVLFVKAISSKDGALLRRLIDEKELIVNLEAKYPEKDFTVKDVERILFFAFSPIKAHKEYLDSLKENYVPDLVRDYIEETNDFKKVRIQWESVYSSKFRHSLIVSWRVKNDGWKVVDIEKDSVDSSPK